MKLRLIALLLALVLLLSGCGGETDAGVRIYYAVSSSSVYSREALRGELWQDAPEELTPELLLARMKEAPQSGELETLLPDRLTLLSWTLEERRLTLNLSEEYSALTGIRLTLANFTLVLTMGQLEGVESVSLTVAGAPLPEGGSGPFSAADLALSGETKDPATLGFQLYLPLSDGSGLGTRYEETEVYGDGLEDQVQAVILLLAQGGESHAGAMDNPFLGLESRLDAEVMEEVCVLTLTGNWAQVLLQSPLNRQALVNSLCELEGVEAVAFQWSGAGEEALEGQFQGDYG